MNEYVSKKDLNFLSGNFSKKKKKADWGIVGREDRIAWLSSWISCLLQIPYTVFKANVCIFAQHLNHTVWGVWDLQILSLCWYSVHKLMVSYGFPPHIPILATTPLLGLATAFLLILRSLYFLSLLCHLSWRKTDDLNILVSLSCSLKPRLFQYQKCLLSFLSLASQ